MRGRVLISFKMRKSIHDTVEKIKKNRDNSEEISFETMVMQNALKFYAENFWIVTVWYSKYILTNIHERSFLTASGGFSNWCYLDGDLSQSNIERQLITGRFHSITEYLTVTIKWSSWIWYIYSVLDRPAWFKNDPVVWYNIFSD